MSKAKMTPFVLLFVWMIGGCESSDSADRIARLQEQLGRVAQQLNETKKQVDGLQEANQRSIQALEDLTATVERLNSAASSSSVGKASKGGTVMMGAKSQEGIPSQSAALTMESKGVMSTRSSDDSQLDTRQAALSDESGATMVAMSCSHVWKQLGQGKTPESAARALGVSVAAVRACEQKVGRNSASR